MFNLYYYTTLAALYLLIAHQFNEDHKLHYSYKSVIQGHSTTQKSRNGPGEKGVKPRR